MLPVQVEFPKFVPDQLLTSDDLNQLFGYLDEQNRMTRTNLIGIGIVCGLQLQVNNAQTEVKITRGCGVTSQGYLVAVETNAYTQYKEYKVDTARVYDRFYKTDGSGNKVAMKVWELRQPAVDPDLHDIDAGFLKDKVILLFVELKEEQNKNCNPNSCDDKGTHVSVSFLPMAVSKDDAQLLMGATGGSFGVNTYTALPELRMKRWDVPNTSPVYSQDIFESYLKLLDKSFVDKVETTLKNIYTVFGSVVAPGYSSNPFSNLSAKFSFLYNGSFNLNQLLHLQYFYDLFSDLLLAYQEFRKAGTHVLSTCCPDENLFPRHLMLGEAVPSVTNGILPFRHYFIYSPLFDQDGMLNELRSLFKRMVLMIDQFFLPTVQGVNTKEDSFIRIIPSMLWDVPLSNKAIPYYYNVNSGSQPLYLEWDYRRTLLNDAKRNLSYHAAQYNSSDDFVTAPLNYDLEPYNFLRVEGIVGKPYSHVLKQVKNQIAKNRLPIDIIALNTEVASSFARSMSFANRADVSVDAMEMICYFQDLESMYDSLRNEVLCSLCKELRYYFDFTFGLMNAFIKKQVVAGETSQVSLFDVCNKEGYVLKDKSLGLMIEFLYRKGLTDETLTIESFFQAFGINVQDINNDDIPDNLTSQQSVIYLALLNFFKIPLGIIRLSTLLTEDLADFDAKAYCAAASKLAEYAKSLKSLFAILTGGAKAVSSFSSLNVNDTAAAGTNLFSSLTTSANTLLRLLAAILLVEDFLDHLDVLIYNCKCSALLSLKNDYAERYKKLTMLRQFGYFTKQHPGVQHKAGVPMGGTFIIVYHSKKRKAAPITNLLRTNEFIKAGATAEKEFSFGRKETTVIEKETLVAGIVVDSEGSPIEGAQVSVEETVESTITSAKGVFRFTGSIIPYTLLVEAAGYEDYRELKTDDDTRIRVVMKEANSNVLDELAAGIVFADFYLPYRCCSDCPPVQYVINETVSEPTPNQGPKADAGPDQVITLPANTVTLNGSASTDPDGSITFFQWAKLSGTNSSFVTPNSSQTDVKDLEEGIYIFELSVTDDRGAIARDTMQVTVNPAPPPENKPPVADAGKDQSIVLNANAFVILDGSNSKDEDGTIVAFKWAQVSGAAATIVSPSLVQTVVNDLQPGVYEFELTVTDNKGATGSDKVMITVAPPANEPPKADAGPDQVITLPSTNRVITLNGSNSVDPEGSALSFQWNVEGGPNTPSITDATKAITTVTGVTSGEYKFSLKVTDDKGASDVDTVVVSVKVTEQPPQKVCGPVTDIIGLFKKLEGVDAQRFPTFINADGFASYGNVKEFFAKLESIANEPVAVQLDFFSNFAPETIVKWLSELQKLIPNRKDIRLLALAMYRILTQVSMYIVCIQPEDFDVAKVPMNRVFSLINSHVKQWTDLAATGVLTAAEKKMIQLIGDDIEKEISRVEANGEAAAKPKYLKTLKTILGIIRTIV